MPFLMRPEAFAKKAFRAIERGASQPVIPWQMGVVAKLLRLLPDAIFDRAVAGQPRKGLIWHFQGSGKSLLMLFAARKLRLHPALKNPTVLVVVDRIDLDSQIAGTFYAADMANLVRTESRKELSDLLSKDARKVIITTIHKFGSRLIRNKMFLEFYTIELRISVPVAISRKNRTIREFNADARASCHWGRLLITLLL
jgi:hypothetical protein